MPMYLTNNARCPKCCRQIIASSRTTNLAGTKYEYFHRNRLVKNCVVRRKAPNDEMYDKTIYAQLHVGHKVF